MKLEIKMVECVHRTWMPPLPVKDILVTILGQEKKYVCFRSTDRP
jgi:hypothetical protein